MNIDQNEQLQSQIKDDHEQLQIYKYLSKPAMINK